MSSDSIQTTILVILMAADPRPLSVEEILKETIGGVTEDEVIDGLNDLFAYGWVQPFESHLPNPDDRPTTLLSDAGKKWLKQLFIETLMEAHTEGGLKQ